MGEKRSYTEVERKQIMEEVRTVKNVAVVARRHNIPEATIHTWIKNNGKNKITTNSLKLALADNKKLLKELTDKDLEINILKELLKKTVQVLS